MDSSSTRVDLEQLKARLAKLGVHIDEPVGEAWDRPWEDAAAETAEAGRSSSRTVAQLLNRCKTVQHALNQSDKETSADTGQDASASNARHHTHRAGGASNNSSSSRRAPGTAAGHDAGAKAAGSVPVVAGKLLAARNAAGDRPVQAGADAADSQLLVRAAQRLLEDAQQDAQQVCHSLRSGGAAAAPGSRAAAPGRLGASGGGGAGRRPLSAAAAAAASARVDDLRNSPLGTVLAQYKEAQAAWAQEKAKLRREAVTARKAAAAAQLELAKLGRSCQHTNMEASALKAALKGRDVLLQELQGNVRQLEEELGKCQDIAAERLVAVTRERDDLQALLLATLERLEGVEAVVAAADATSAAMEDKVRVLEAERLAALQTAAAARQEVAQLQEARRRLQWQSQLLEKMSEVQLRHNKRKSSAIKELLAHASEAASAVAASESPCEGQGQQEGYARAGVALQDLLDELLTTGGDDSGDEGPSSA